tara:strand:- start:6824 stop:6976 length:153 start_codon:yes stop_codon:yes gene_type:complete
MAEGLTVVCEALKGALNASHDTPATVTFCCFGAADTEHYREALAEEGIFL